MASRNMHSARPRRSSSMVASFSCALGEIVGLKGDAPSGPFVVIAFDSVEDAQAWASSPEYTAIVPMRDEAADLRAFIVEGVAP